MLICQYFCPLNFITITLNSSHLPCQTEELSELFWFTQLDLVVTESNGENVKAILTTNFALFITVANVKLQLYSSETKTDDISDMTLEGSVTSADLDMGKSISVVASTHNEGRYWVAYALYYRSSTNIQTYKTSPAYFDAEGINYPAL